MCASTPPLQRRPVLAAALLFAGLGAVAAAARAQPKGREPDAGAPPAAAAVPPDLARMDLLDWLRRMHVAARQSNYVGTFVVSAGTGELSSARIWHAYGDGVQVERVEALSGPPRSTFRRNDLILTFLPESRVVKSERRDNVDAFPNLAGAPDPAIASFYGVELKGKGRVAGIDADLVQIVPRDNLRFGYRVWSERQSGLVLKLQTIDPKGGVVEQSAFSEVQLGAPLKAQALLQMMASTEGYRVEKSELERTSAKAEGWTLQAPVAGFKPVNCYRRVLSTRGPSVERAVQWTFSDGLATVSLFIEPFDPARAGTEGAMQMGATYTLTRRIGTPGADWWLTAVGEVPPRTLDAFARGLGRIP